MKKRTTREMKKDSTFSRLEFDAWTGKMVEKQNVELVKIMTYKFGNHFGVK